MKNIGLTCLLLIGICCGLQAKKTVKAPYFTATNTRSLEIGKVTLGKDTTWLEVKIYGMAGDKVMVDPGTVLRASGKDYAYWGCTGLAGDGTWTVIPASGELAATLKFMPVPEDTESFDYIETPTEGEGWSIFGVRLDGKKPQPDIPERLLNRQLDYSLPLPAPELNCGKSVVKGQLLGYKPEYGVKLNFSNSHWFFQNFRGDPVPIAEDGTFRYEADVLMPCGGSLRVGSWELNLFLVPGGELDITLNMPEIFMSQSRLFGQKLKGETERRVWFEGDYAALNTELLYAGEWMSLSGGEDFFSDICGMTPSAYKKYVFKTYDNYQKKLDERKELSQACRTYVKANLDMSLFSCINSFKHNLSYAPLFSGKKGVKRADMTVDSTAYFKEVLDLDILHSPYLKYYGFYTDFVRLATDGWLHGRFAPEPVWNDILLGKRASRSLNSQMPLTAEERLTIDSISMPELKQVFYDRSRKIEARLEAVKGKAGYTVVEVGKEIGADSLLQVVTRPYRGKMILVDMWNTWCGPCIRAMKSLQPLKEELKDVVYLYIADETSPEGKWKLTIPDIHGIHHRITNQQSAALSKLYGYPGIPTYFIVNRKGEISYKVTGFPGVEKLREELTK